jgi:hypothetical protein
MKEIPLTNGGTTVVDDCDYDFLHQFYWRKKRSHGSNKYHAVRDVVLGGLKVTVRMHRLIAEAKTDEVVFHINGDGLDNRRRNLQNRQINPWTGRADESGFLGVHRVHGGYESRIKFTGKTYFLGIFDEAEDAARHYDHTAYQLYGQNARTNFNDVK